MGLGALLLGGASWAGCADPPAQTYVKALHAETWDEASALCRRVSPEELLAECLVAVMQRHGRLDEADCEAVPAGKWQEECLFLYAERAAQAGETEAAFDACNRTHFGRECAYHLVREGARRARDLPPDEAAAFAEGWEGLKRAPDADALFWKAWFREQLAVDRPVDPSECPTTACTTSAREVLTTTLAAQAKLAGPSLCITRTLSPLVGAKLLWVSGPMTDRWVASWTERECQRQSGVADLTDGEGSASEGDPGPGSRGPPAGGPGRMGPGGPGGGGPGGPGRRGPGAPGDRPGGPAATGGPVVNPE